MSRAMTIPGNISKGMNDSGSAFDRTGCSESICVYTSSAVLGRKLVYVDLYNISMKK